MSRSMSRSIKFRIWDKRMKDFSSAEKNDAKEFFIYFGGNRGIRCYDGYSEKTIIWDEEWKNRYEVQQFTGLKDKNGTDIFEGDIIRQGNPRFSYEVKFGKVNDSRHWRSGFYLSAIQYNDNTFDFNPDEYEILGNIFENPELLK